MAKRPQGELARLREENRALRAHTGPAMAGVFDPELALKRCFNQHKMLTEMVQCFFSDVASLLPQMRAALHHGDVAETARLAHRLKGTVVYLGAEPASAAARRLESWEQYKGSPAEAAEALRALEQACEALKTAIKTHDFPAGHS